MSEDDLFVKRQQKIWTEVCYTLGAEIEQVQREARIDELKTLAAEFEDWATHVEAAVQYADEEGALRCKHEAGAYGDARDYVRERIAELEAQA